MKRSKFLENCVPSAKEVTARSVTSCADAIGADAVVASAQPVSAAKNAKRMAEPLRSRKLLVCLRFSCQFRANIIAVGFRQVKRRPIHTDRQRDGRRSSLSEAPARGAVSTVLEECDG